MAAIFLSGWVGSLNADLSTSATRLPLRSVDAERLCARLGDNHSYLLLTNGSDAEVVRVECFSGVPTITRGDNPIAVPNGGCARFEVTAELLGDFVTPADAICEIIGEGGINVEQEGCVVTLTLGADCENVSWRSGNYSYRFENGCVVRTLATGGCSLVPGTYSNATITVNSDGLICGIEAGSNIVFSHDPCCGDCP